ncbi:sulfur oxidation c-type cytochrome SoxX [Sinisalibacter aestuarii]|uniref:Sulfur oxidation c-type cytochrome SoxX n=1 Tax=Sinisalibacter aestuarii TaxID=2949426 RepID=A0ABQ5LZ21_9RHOB|nr:sulfur oxidation c-type cytochrome SoxX [Sinisalibacter aestuarii]GKY90229.1 sulfur oxidation c-type cytochrome SoxX [Sinisalibacter aestuarii]
MRKLFVLCTAGMVMLPSVLAAETAPGDVVFGDLGAVEESLTGTAGNAEAGLEVATTRSLGNCLACHVAEGWAHMPLPGNIGPALTSVAHRYTEAELRGILINSKHMFEGTVMPSFYNVDDIIRPGDGYTGKAATSVEPLLSAQQIEDLLALLQTFDEPEEE